MLPPCGSDPSPLFLLQIIEWLCDNVNTFSCFDQIQEFILGQFQRFPQIGPIFLSCILFYLFHLLWRIWWLLRTWKLRDSSHSNNIFSRFTAARVLLIDPRPSILTNHLIFMSIFPSPGSSVTTQVLNDQSRTCFASRQGVFFCCFQWIWAQSGVPQTSLYLLYQDPSGGSAIIDVSRFTTWKPEAVPGSSPGAALRNGVSGTFKTKVPSGVHAWRISGFNWIWFFLFWLKVTVNTSWRSSFFVEALKEDISFNQVWIK